MARRGFRIFVDEGNSATGPGRVGAFLIGYHENKASGAPEGSDYTTRPMDFAYFLNILLRRKWLILSVALLAAVTTYFVTQQLPSKWQANAVLETGISRYQGLTLTVDNPFVQEWQINGSFDNMIKSMTSRSQIKQLTKQLLYHDLVLAAETGIEPFRVPDVDEEEVDLNDVNDFIAVLANFTPDSLQAFRAEKHNSLKVSDLAKMYGYDQKSIAEDLTVARLGDSDNIEVSFVSDNPELSYFVVNNFVNNYLSLYEDETMEDSREQVKFYTEQQAAKRAELNSLNNRITGTRAAKSLADLDGQKNAAITSIKELELQRDNYRQRLPALREKKRDLESTIIRYNSRSGNTQSGTRALRDEIDALADQMADLTTAYVRSGSKNEKLLEKKERLEAKRDAKMKQLAAATGRTGSESDAEFNRKRVETLRGELRQTEYLIDEANASISNIDQTLLSLQGRKRTLVTDEGDLSAMQARKVTVEREYQEVTNELYKAELKLRSLRNPLAVVEPAQIADEPEPKKSMLLSAFSGVAGGTLASIFIFLAAFFDNTTQNPTQFRKLTRLPVLGALPRIKAKNLDPAGFFEQAQKPRLEYFKENIRKLRYTLLQSGKQVFLFASADQGSGKSFLAIMLAHALQVVGKRVLIIDTNFKNNTLSGYAAQQAPAAMGNAAYREGVPARGSEHITILGNQGGNFSPSEVLGGEDFKRVLDNYRLQYDYIFLEAPALAEYSDARELAMYADRVIGVFAADTKLAGKNREAIEYFQQLDKQYLGTVVNRVNPKH